MYRLCNFQPIPWWISETIQRVSVTRKRYNKSQMLY